MTREQWLEELRQTTRALAALTLKCPFVLDPGAAFQIGYLIGSLFKLADELAAEQPADTPTLITPANLPPADGDNIPF